MEAQPHPHNPQPKRPPEILTESGLSAAAPQEAAGASSDSDGGTTTGTSNNTTSPSNAAQFGRMVIRTAQISLLVENTDDAEVKVRNLVQSMGGYVLSSETRGDEESRNVALTFKVPAERFDDALNSVASFATKVQNRSVTGEDVTDQFVDTEARLRTLRATETRLLDFLKAAQTTEEALQVNQQLTNLQGEIEQASGRIQLLKQSTAFSTITVTMQPNIALALTANSPWSPGIRRTPILAELDRVRTRHRRYRNCIRNLVASMGNNATHRLPGMAAYPAQ